MNAEAFQGIRQHIVNHWPIIVAALSLSWIFVRLTIPWLSKAWLRWASTLLIGAIAWIPFQGLPIGTFLSPLTSSISLFSIVLMIASIQVGQGRILPASVWALLFLLGIALQLDTFAMSPWRIHQWGYSADTSRMGQLVTALILSLLIFLIALRRPWLSAICLLPAFCWRFDLSPSPNLWDAYVDLPLVLVACFGLLSHFLRSSGNRHE